MAREFVYTEPFRKCWKAMGLSEDDLKKGLWKHNRATATLLKQFLTI